MKIKEIILAKRWKNFKTGRTASIYGAVPYTSDKADWHIETTGYTWLCSDGTVGLGRIPAKTLQEAQQVMDKCNNY